MASTLMPTIASAGATKLDGRTAPRPVCFMVMPFSTKDTRGPAPAPSRVDFDALWEKAFYPVLEELGYQPVRADQVGALIIKEMIERLYFSDLVVADLTIPNGNVYSEVGIRHAAKDVGCVLVGASWSDQGRHHPQLPGQALALEPSAPVPGARSQRR